MGRSCNSPDRNFELANIDRAAAFSCEWLSMGHLATGAGGLRRSSHRGTGRSSEKVWLKKGTWELLAAPSRVCRRRAVERPFGLSAEGVASNAPPNIGRNGALQRWLLRRSVDLQRRRDTTDRAAHPISSTRKISPKRIRIPEAMLCLGFAATPIQRFRATLP